MPEAEIARRGGARRWRTLKLPNGKYVKVAVVRKAGPRGGHTIAGPIRKKGDFGGPADGVHTKKKKAAR